MYEVRNAPRVEPREAEENLISGNMQISYLLNTSRRGETHRPFVLAANAKKVAMVLLAGMLQFITGIHKPTTPNIETPAVRQTQPREGSNPGHFDHPLHP